MRGFSKCNPNMSHGVRGLLSHSKKAHLIQHALKGGRNFTIGFLNRVGENFPKVFSKIISCPQSPIHTVATNSPSLLSSMWLPPCFPLPPFTALLPLCPPLAMRATMSTCSLWTETVWQSLGKRLFSRFNNSSSSSRNSGRMWGHKILTLLTVTDGCHHRLIIYLGGNDKSPYLTPNTFQRV